MKKILIVFNNNSGKKKATILKRTIFNRLKEVGACFKFVHIDVLPILKDIKRFDTIIAVGGDGTVLKVLPYVVNTSAKLGIIPCGTANLFAEGLLIPHNVDRALDAILYGKISQIDIGKAENQYFSLRVGLGYDADIIKNTKSNLKNKLGYLAYFLQGIVSLFKLSSKNYKINIDGKELNIKANSIIVANAGNMFKNLITIAPKGSLSDGKLDVFILCAKNIIDFIGVFLQILFGIHRQNSNVVYAQASNISIQTAESFMHVDGENKNFQNSLNIQIIPQAVKVLVP